TALTAAVDAYLASPEATAGQKTALAADVQALSTAVAAFTALQSGNLAAPVLAREVLAAVGQVAAAVPGLSPQVQVGVATTVAVLQAFLANVPMSVPAPRLGLAL
ncbi:MAG: hypothetical protein ACP5NI_09040, partial [Acetobacteraceae bacterium]